MAPHPLWGARGDQPGEPSHSKIERGWALHARATKTTKLPNPLALRRGRTRKLLILGIGVGSRLTSAPVAHRMLGKVDETASTTQPVTFLVSVKGVVAAQRGPLTTNSGVLRPT